MWKRLQIGDNKWADLQRRAQKADKEPMFSKKAVERRLVDQARRRNARHN